MDAPAVQNVRMWRFHTTTRPGVFLITWLLGSYHLFHVQLPSCHGSVQFFPVSFEVALPSKEGPCGVHELQFLYMYTCMLIQTHTFTCSFTPSFFNFISTHTLTPLQNDTLTHSCTHLHTHHTYTYAGTDAYFPLTHVPLTEIPPALIPQKLVPIAFKPWHTSSTYTYSTYNSGTFTYTDLDTNTDTCTHTDIHLYIHMYIFIPTCEYSFMPMHMS